MITWRFLLTVGALPHFVCCFPVAVPEDFSSHGSISVPEWVSVPHTHLGELPEKDHRAQMGSHPYPHLGGLPRGLKELRWGSILTLTWRTSWEDCIVQGISVQWPGECIWGLSAPGHWNSLGVCSHSCPLSRRCHPTISSSVIPFSSRLQSFPASGSVPMSWFFASGGQNIGGSGSASVLPMNIQGWFSLELTSLVSLLSTGLPRVFSSTTV